MIPVKVWRRRGQDSLVFGFEVLELATRSLRTATDSIHAPSAYKLLYMTAKFGEENCFQKKTQATSKQDKEIAAARYRAVISARKGKR